MRLFLMILRIFSDIAIMIAGCVIGGSFIGATSLAFNDWMIVFGFIAVVIMQLLLHIFIYDELL